MPTVADALRKHGPAYLEKFGQRMPEEHRKTLAALCACRTGELGHVVYQCQQCGEVHRMGKSCGNRHCPTCQQDKAKAWLKKQMDRLLPCPYFLITFTVPAELRPWVRSHQRIAYEAMFAASSEALKTMAAEPRHVGAATPGFFGVLHTWGRDLTCHPHIHYVVCGGGLDQSGAAWKGARVNYFVPARALSILYRAKMRDAFDRAGLLDQIDPSVWSKDWVVDSQAVGDGCASLKYLAPYVYRVAISDRRILSVDDQTVKFSYRKSGASHWRPMTVSGEEFVRRFLQHVLPANFTKIRYYGFLHPRSKVSVESACWLATVFYGLVYLLLPKEKEKQAALTAPCCSACGGPLVMTGFVPAADGPAHVVPILDSS